MVKAEDVVAALTRVRDATEAAQGELDRLDALAGDGDHGVTMVVGWRGVVAALDASDAQTPGAVLRIAAEAFANVGGTAGPLWGTALLRASRALGDAHEIDAHAIGAAARAAADGMRERGRCANGDRTVVDAMAPAADALARDGDLRAAARAAADGAAATAELTPRRGRAARAPDRVRGTPDAGARAAAVFWAALADC